MTFFSKCDKKFWRRKFWKIITKCLEQKDERNEIKFLKFWSKISRKKDTTIWVKKGLFCQKMRKIAMSFFPSSSGIKVTKFKSCSRDQNEQLWKNCEKKFLAEKKHISHETSVNVFLWNTVQVIFDMCQESISKLKNRKSWDFLVVCMQNVEHT